MLRCVVPNDPLKVQNKGTEKVPSFLGIKIGISILHHHIIFIVPFYSSYLFIYMSLSSLLFISCFHSFLFIIFGLVSSFSSIYLFFVCFSSFPSHSVLFFFSVFTSLSLSISVSLSLSLSLSLFSLFLSLVREFLGKESGTGSGTPLCL